MSCPTCGQELPGRAKFCSECGTPLSVEPARRREERKVVSVLFCDLVNFTAASESADPEDVRARLVPYYAMLRDRVEAFGGTVEKFIGDAVMAVFGAPVAHEDDAERAVRAGLAILSAIENLNASAGMDLSVRVGVNTGEVVVALDARPELGEGLVTGDAVNTAARIQSAAPVGGVAVGEPTYAATSRVFAYESLDAVSAKGKADPLRLWRAGAPRARLGADVIRSTDAPLVGRDLEMLQLRGVFDRVARDGAVHLVTITGEPGVGKSRLVAELFAHVEGLPELVTWRTGRCLPYGDGVTFWALGEIVKSHAGILDTDEIDAATAKLDAVLPAGEDRSWLRARLLPLVGVTNESAMAGASGASQEESFTAWRRFLESLTATGPAVLVVEDIHWADPALLSFLEHLVSWAHGVPLLVVCTARPELFDAHHGWGSGLRNTLTMNLSPLSQTETATVVSHLLGLSVIPAATQQLILERAEGNPLWVEECVRVLRDRGLIDPQGRLHSDEVPLPYGVQALIAARLDTLPAEHKALLADAAVVGRVFWADAAAALGQRAPDQVIEVLHELTGKEFVRPHRESALGGHAEFSFWHGLVHDVAYQTLPRPARAVKHVAASRWLEQQAGDRVSDVAEILADHTNRALDLAEAAGDASLVDQVTSTARRYSLLAADKAMALNSTRAMWLLDRALALSTAEDSDYPDVLVLWARAAVNVGRPREAVTAFQEAADHYHQRHDLLSAGAALRNAASHLINVGDPRGRPLLEHSLHLLGHQQPSAELGHAILHVANNHFDSGSPEEALAIAERVETLISGGDPFLVGAYHMVRGLARRQLGDADGLPEIERGIQILNDANLTHAAAVAVYNLADQSAAIAGPEATLSQLDSGEAYCQARGLPAASAWLRVKRVGCLAQIGRLRDALAIADTLLPDFEEAGDDMSFCDVAVLKTSILLEVDGSDGRVAQDALRAARRTDSADLLAMAETAAALESWAAGRPEEAGALLATLPAHPGIEKTQWAAVVHQAVRCAVGLGDIQLAEGLVARLAATESAIPLHQHSLLTAQAVLAHAHREYGTAVKLFAEAVRRWDAFGSRLDLAHALLGLGESCLAGGYDDAEDKLRQALDLFTTMGADHRVRQCQQLLRRGTESDPRTA